MASYKKLKKKDNFLFKLGITFAGIFTILVLSLVLYDTFSQELDYDSFDHLDTYASFTQQAESEYLVYYYAESCSACQTIKNNVLTFADSNAANMKVYFADASDLDVGNNNYPGLTGTPGVLHIKNGTLINIQTGSTNVTPVMANINLEAKE